MQRASPPCVALQVAAPALWRPAPPRQPARRQRLRPASATPATHEDSTRWWGDKTRGTSELRGKRPPPSPELVDAVLPLATVCSADLAATARAVACLGPGLQLGVLNHGLEVAQWLRAQGVGQDLLQPLLRRCLPLFAQPPEKRAAVLLGQLTGLGLSASQAARCFERAPLIGVVPHGYGPAIGALAALLEEGSVSGRPGRRLLADLLAGQPAAAALLALAPGMLRQHADALLALGLSTAELVAAVQKDALLLTVDPDELMEQEAVLREELGADPGVFAAMLLLEPTAVVEGCAHALQQRVARLVEEFGQQGALDTVMDMPTLLTVDEY